MNPDTAMQTKLDHGAAAAELIDMILRDKGTFSDNPSCLPAAERSIYMCLMSLIDSCKLALTTVGFSLSTPDCRAVVEFAASKELIDAGAARRLVAMAGLPHRLTHDYEQVTPIEVYGYLAPVLGLFNEMAPRFRSLIDSKRRES